MKIIKYVLMKMFGFNNVKLNDKHIGNEKIIYIISRGHSIYYIPIDSLELFLGISGIKVSHISAKVRRLSDLVLKKK